MLFRLRGSIRAQDVPPSTFPHIRTSDDAGLSVTAEEQKQRRSLLALLEVARLLSGLAGRPTMRSKIPFDAPKRLHPTTKAENRVRPTRALFKFQPHHSPSPHASICEAIAMKHRPLCFLLPGICLALALQLGCGSSVRQRSSVAQSSDMPSTTASATSLPPYRLGFGDVLEIKFFNNREFNETVPVRPDGRITIEKVGEIEVAGKTAVYVDSIVTQTYAQFVRDPEVTVIVREFGSNYVYVFGEVYSPGKLPVGQGMTLLQALAAAGGPKDTAKLNSVLIIRRGVDARPVATRVELKPARENSHSGTGLAVQPLDVIYVPRTFIADLSSFMSKFYDAIFPPFDAYLRALFYVRQ